MKLNVYLRYYKAFENVPDEVIPELAKLNLGRQGIMKDYVPLCDGKVVKVKVPCYWNNDGYYSDRRCPKCNDNHFHQSKTAKRYLVVAYDGRTDKAVGWSMVDECNYINIFVARRWRRKGLATKIVVHGCKYMPKTINVHNAQARDVVIEASKRSKFKKVVPWYGY